MAGFLPSLAELADGRHTGLHTIYVSPLKALAADIRRNLRIPVDEIGLPIRIEDRTGDTSATQKKRQRADPPHILLTTPESLALLTSYEDAPRMFDGVQRVVIDEIHALADSKRGDQLMLALSRVTGHVSRPAPCRAFSHGRGPRGDCTVSGPPPRPLQDRSGRPRPRP